MKKLFYVGVYLKDRVPFGMYGFTSYVDGFTEAMTPEEAKEIVITHFETKHRTIATGARVTLSNQKFCNTNELIKPIKTPIQDNLFHSTLNRKP